MTSRSTDRRTFALAAIGALAGVKLASAQPATPAASPVAESPALYSIQVPISDLPAAPIAAGVAGVIMSAGASVLYPEGAAGQSVAIDHVLAGGYTIETDGEVTHIDRTGKETEHEAGETVTVAAGETIVLLHNEAAQKIMVGVEETRTVTMGFFALSGGTNEMTSTGSIEQQLFGGTVLQSLPESDMTVTIIPSDQASQFSDPFAEFPFTLDSGEEWTAVVLETSQE